MIVGFTIQGYSIKEANAKAVAKFLVESFILPSPQVATNVVNAVMKGSDVNIFMLEPYINSKLSGINEQPWSYSLISVQNGEHLLVSAVDFKLEFVRDTIYILRPTEYIRITGREASLFEQEVRQKLVRIIPPVTEGEEDFNLWILYKSVWNDDGIWIDSETWRN